MTDDIHEKRRVYNLSRRRVLGGIGAVGLASAGAGLGTTALFSDTEQFEGNVLAAGSLDLVVDWEEHYYYDQVDELDLRYSIDDLSDEDAAMYVGFPDPEAPMLYVHGDDIEAFMDATAIEAYPDVDDDGIQDPDLLENFVACEDFAQLDANLNPDEGRGAGKRSANEDTILNFGDWGEGADPEVAPLVNLHDVKPGDFGELTLSFHLCDNPGYIWLQGDLVEARENGHTEPEAEDPDEVGGPNTVNDTGNDVEILDEIQTMLWYDEDGDNIYEPSGAAGGEADIVIVLDTSGSMNGAKLANAKAGAKTLVDAVGSNVRVAVVGFSTQEYLAHELSTDKASLKSAIDGLSATNTTNIEGGINAARDILTPGGDYSAEVDPGVTGDPTTDNIMVVLSDGSPNVDDDGDASVDPRDEATAAKGDGIEIYTIAYGVTAGSSLALLMEDLASIPKDSHAYLAADVDEVEAIFAQIGQIVAGEECFFEGSLRDLLDLTSTDTGIPLDGIRATPYAEVTGDDLDGDGCVDDNYGLGDGTAPEREEFVNSTNNYIGLAWWLPVDHANEIQTDSVSFDLGFYTEQSRHNDGAGMFTA